MAPLEVTQHVATRGCGKHVEESKRRRSNALELADESLEAFLLDSFDSVPKAEHALSERRRPSAASLQPAISAKSRVDLLKWMTQTFEIMQFDDAVLHSVVLTLDRYYAAHCSKINDGLLQLLVLTVLCVELKTSCSVEYPQGLWKRYLQHISQGQISVEEILTSELGVLGRLGFVVGVPTPLTFLRGIVVRNRDDALAPRLLSLGTFLLEMALFDPELEYSRPHSLLAAGAFSAALRALGEPPAAWEEFLVDYACYWPGVEAAGGAKPRAKELDGELEGLRVKVLHCERDLLMLWLRCEEGSDSPVESFYAHLQAKFSSQARCRAGVASPMETFSRFCQACSDLQGLGQ